MPKIVKTLLGTAREAKENFDYSKMEEKYGKETAKGILKPYLEEIGITVKDFMTYRDVKNKIQNNKLNIAEINKNLEKEKNDSITKVFPSYAIATS